VCQPSSRTTDAHTLFPSTRRGIYSGMYVCACVFVCAGAAPVPSGGLLLALVGDVPSTAADVSLCIREWALAGAIATPGAAVECAPPATTEVRARCSASLLYACRALPCHAVSLGLLAVSLTDSRCSCVWVQNWVMIGWITAPRSAWHRLLLAAPPCWRASPPLRSRATTSTRGLRLLWGLPRLLRWKLLLSCPSFASAVRTVLPLTGTLCEPSPPTAVPHTLAAQATRFHRFDRPTLSMGPRRRFCRCVRRVAFRRALWCRTDRTGDRFVVQTARRSLHSTARLRRLCARVHPLLLLATSAHAELQL
jgi:hypothetical protein